MTRFILPAPTQAPEPTPRAPMVSLRFLTWMPADPLLVTPEWGAYTLPLSSSIVLDFDSDVKRWVFPNRELDDFEQSHKLITGTLYSNHEIQPLYFRYSNPARKTLRLSEYQIQLLS